METAIIRRAAFFVILISAVAGVTEPAWAQISRLGGPFSIPMPAVTQTRFPDVAFDQNNSVYLAVAGGTPVRGSLLSEDGVSFDGNGFSVASVNCGTIPGCSWHLSMAPRTAYGEGGIFLVTWLDTRRVVSGKPPGSVADIWGRLVQSGVGPVGPEFEIAQCEYGAQSESPAAVAYSPQSHEFLVSWTQLKKGVRARRVSLAGAVLGPEIAVSSDADGPGQSSVGYDSVANNFFIAWAAYDYDPADNFAYVAGVRVQAGTGTVLGSPSVLKTGVYSTIPQVLFNPRTGKYMVAWYEQGSPSPICYARMITSAGTFDGGVIPVTTYATYDALGVARNPVTDTYLMLTHDAGGVEDLAMEVSAAGVASAPIAATANGGTGNFNPRAASHSSRPQWLLVTAKSFLTPAGQRMQTATVPPPVVSVTGPSTVDVEPGGRIDVTGSGFGATRGSGTILLGATALNVRSWSDGDIAADVPANAQSAAVTVVVNGTPHTGPFVVVRRPGMRQLDFDGDRKPDLALYRPGTGTWFSLDSSAENQTYRYRGWGVTAQGDIPVRGDFDGDGIVDPAVFRDGTGTWFILYSSTNFTTWTYFGWGASGDIPVTGDYDGDGKTDAAVFRPSTGRWYIRPSSGATQWNLVFGTAGDFPMPVDYDGDGKTDIAVFRPSTGTWFILKSSSGNTDWYYRGWGVAAAGDTPVPGDYDGDGKADVAVFRPTTGTWFILKSSANDTGWMWDGWGAVGDRPVAADYDGDGRTDLAVYRPAGAIWYVKPSSGAAPWFVTFGQAGDIPLQGIW